jgi:hypothetical protein
VPSNINGRARQIASDGQALECLPVERVPLNVSKSYLSILIQFAISARVAQNQTCNASVTIDCMVREDLRAQLHTRAPFRTRAADSHVVANFLVDNEGDCMLA